MKNKIGETFARLTNRIIAALADARLPGSVRTVFDYVVLHTYGAKGSPTSAPILASDVAIGCRLPKSTVFRALGFLLKAQILREYPSTAQHVTRNLGVNRYVETWRIEDVRVDDATKRRTKARQHLLFTAGGKPHSRSPNGETRSPNGETRSPNGETRSPNGETRSPNGETPADSETASTTTTTSSTTRQKRDIDPAGSSSLFPGIDTHTSEQPKDRVDELVSRWNELAKRTKMPICKKLDAKRRRFAAEAIAEGLLDSWDAFAVAFSGEAGEWHRSRSIPPNFDWLVRAKLPWLPMIEKAECMAEREEAKSEEDLAYEAIMRQPVAT